MKSCKRCLWCRVGLTTKYIYKCKLNPKKRFNNAKIKGWFCKQFIDESKVGEK